MLMQCLRMLMEYQTHCLMFNTFLHWFMLEMGTHYWFKSMFVSKSHIWPGSLSMNYRVQQLCSGSKNPIHLKIIYKSKATSLIIDCICCIISHESAMKSENRNKLLVSKEHFSSYTLSWSTVCEWCNRVSLYMLSNYLNFYKICVCNGGNASLEAVTSVGKVQRYCLSCLPWAHCVLTDPGGVRHQGVEMGRVRDQGAEMGRLVVGLGIRGWRWVG